MSTAEARHVWHVAHLRHRSEHIPRVVTMVIQEKGELTCDSADMVFNFPNHRYPSEQKRERYDSYNGRPYHHEREREIVAKKR